VLFSLNRKCSLRTISNEHPVCVRSKLTFPNKLQEASSVSCWARGRSRARHRAGSECTYVEMLHLETPARLAGVQGPGQ
jgi:hypothetical protein